MRLILTCAFAASLAAVAPAGEPSFAAKPTAAKAGDGTKISFAVAAPTDVEVSILGADGKVVRHLAAGMLGKNAPEPFKKDALAQEVLWDGKDDAGKPAGGGCKARVRLGLGAELERMIPPEPDPMSSPTAIGVGANGDVYVLSNRYMTAGVYIYVLDRQGKYLRTILPSPSTLKTAQVKGLERLKLPGGKEVPIVYGGYTSDTGPFLSGFRSQRLEVTSQGWIVMASGANDMWDQTVPRHVLIIKPDGTTPEETGFVGPNLGPKSRYGSGVREQQLAAAPDGKTLYFAGMGMDGKTPKGIHCIGKLGFDSKGPETFVGKPDEAGTDGEHLNSPETVSTDAKGNVLVADLGNDRVAVFGPDGKFLGETKVKAPKYISVHPKTGAMYVSTHPGEIKAGKARPFSVIKFDKAIDGKEVARIDLSGKYPVLALDPGAEPAKLWLANDGGLFPVADGGAKLDLGANVIKPVAGSLVSPLYLSADAPRDRLYVADFRLNILSVDLKTGQSKPFLKASEPAVDRDGNVYVYDSFGSNSISRYSPDGKPLPFATGSNKLAIKFRNGLPNVGVKGLTVAPNGDIYAYQDNNTAGGMHVWVFGADGKVKKENIVKDMPPDSGTGLAADHAGNFYAGINIHDPKGFYPADFGDQIPQLAWYTPYDPKKSSWYARPQRGMPDAPPWNRPYLNFYLYQYGSVFKFGPEGGTLWSGPVGKGGDTARPEGVPADAKEYRNGYLGQAVWLSGAKWEYRGFGICANRTEGWGDPGCSCMSSRFAIDEHDRLFIPDVFRFSVGVVDTAGNQITRIGAYGNVDSAGPKSMIPEPAIPLAMPNAVTVGGGKVYVADRKNRRIVVIGLKYAAEENCEVK